ncbi:hypothetical protein WJX72_012498 [[Myrmecia] bisecta]|uniref:Uncharacterized protein n=1 Tax=[Myrmecia] bisecta TaxID=41462 RepID=A0AAW1PAR4_9CHLO
MRPSQLPWIAAVLLLLYVCACQAAPAISIIDGNVVTTEGAVQGDSLGAALPGENPTCAAFNYKNPGGRDPVAISDGCWNAYKRFCDFNFKTPESDCPELPGVGPDTPKSWDWRDHGIVGPVTSQAGSTCFVHAGSNFMTSFLIKNKIPDVTGKAMLKSDMGISPQPYIDCYTSQDVCNTGGYEDTVIR